MRTTHKSNAIVASSVVSYFRAAPSAVATTGATTRWITRAHEAWEALIAFNLLSMMVIPQSASGVMRKPYAGIHKTLLSSIRYLFFLYSRVTFSIHSLLLICVFSVSVINCIGKDVM